MTRWPTWFRAFMSFVLMVFDGMEEKPEPCPCPFCRRTREQFERKRRKMPT